MPLHINKSGSLNIRKESMIKADSPNKVTLDENRANRELQVNDKALVRSLEMQ